MVNLTGCPLGTPICNLKNINETEFFECLSRNYWRSLYMDADIDGKVNKLTEFLLSTFDKFAPTPYIYPQVEQNLPFG